MTPKITKDMGEALLKEGGRKKRTVKPPPEAKTPIPEPAPQTDLTPLTGAIGELVSQLQEQLNVAQGQIQALQRQNTQLEAVAVALMSEKPMRFKPIRDMDRESPTYLLVEHYDMIPVQYTPKLNS